MKTTTIRIDLDTRRLLKRIAAAQRKSLRLLLRELAELAVKRTGIK